MGTEPPPLTEEEWEHLLEWAEKRFNSLFLYEEDEYFSQQYFYETDYHLGESE